MVKSFNDDFSDNETVKADKYENKIIFSQKILKKK